MIPVGQIDNKSKATGEKPAAHYSTLKEDGSPRDSIRDVQACRDFTLKEEGSPRDSIRDLHAGRKSATTGSTATSYHGSGITRTRPLRRSAGFTVAKVLICFSVIQLAQGMTEKDVMALKEVEAEVAKYTNMSNGDGRDKEKMLAAVDKWLEKQLAENADDYEDDDVNEKIHADEDIIIKEEADKKRAIINRVLAGCDVNPAMSVHRCPATADPTEGEPEGDDAVKETGGHTITTPNEDKRRRLLRAQEIAAANGPPRSRA